MKKIYIVVQSQNSIHKIDTHDLFKMYYFQKIKLPTLPTFYTHHSDQSSVHSSLNNI